MPGFILGQQVITVPEGKELAIAGILRHEHGYGPPGYGEDKHTDAKIAYWVVELSTPITTPCTPERPEWASVDCKSTKVIRLFLPLLPEGAELTRRVEAAKNMRVLMTGIVHRQDTLGETTPVYMNVTDIKVVKDPKN